MQIRPSTEGPDAVGGTGRMRTQVEVPTLYDMQPLNGAVFSWVDATLPLRVSGAFHEIPSTHIQSEGRVVMDWSSSDVAENGAF